MIFNELKERLVLFSEKDGYEIHFGDFVGVFHPQLIASELVNVQPLPQPEPLGLLLYMHFIFDRFIDSVATQLIPTYKYGGMTFYGFEQMQLGSRG